MTNCGRVLTTLGVVAFALLSTRSTQAQLAGDFVREFRDEARLRNDAQRLRYDLNHNNAAGVINDIYNINRDQRRIQRDERRIQSDLYGRPYYPQTVYINPQQPQYVQARPFYTQQVQYVQQVQYTQPVATRYQVPAQYSGTAAGYVISWGGMNYLTNGDGTMSPYSGAVVR